MKNYQIIREIVAVKSFLRDSYGAQIHTEGRSILVSKDMIHSFVKIHSVDRKVLFRKVHYLF